MPASQGFLLAIDLGTTACKASLFTLDGWRVGICRASIRLYSPEPSAAEQEPDEWRAALELSLRQLSQQYPEAIQTVVGIGLAAQMNALVLMDSQNNPMGRVQSAMDQRAVPYSTRLRAEYASDFPDIYFGRSTSLGRIAWLRDQRPQLFENCAHISDACGLLSYWLTGTFASDASIGVWRWTPELAAILGVPLNMLPEIRMPWEITGRLLPEFARRAGLPAGIPVVAGSGDGPCTNIGAGALRLSESCVTLGTTGVVRVVLPSPLPVHVSTPIFSYPFINGLWLGGGYYPAGACLQWLRNLLEAGGPPQSEWDWLQRYLNQPDYQAKLQQCIHCGLCLQACPTYMLLGTEMDSPRGRISLIRAASEGRIDFAGAFQEHIQLCLACRACESACPSGVQYGSLVEMARISIEERRQPDLFERVVRWLALRQLMPRLPRLKSIARLARLYQSLGLSALVHRMAFLPQRLKTTEGLLPPMPQHYADYRQPAPALGIQHGRVAFFYGCIQEAFLAQVNQATIRVLQTNGYEVHFPTAQTCCGAAQLHLGEATLARQLARQNIDAFLQADAAHGPFMAIINNAGGCGASLKEYTHLLKEDSLYAEKASRFSALVKDISEFLAGHLNVLPSGEVRARVTYADSCHLRHAQKVVDPPRRLLQSVPGIELVELKQPDQCCGSAGVYNIVQVETANAILDGKMSDIATTGAEIIVTTNAGCYMQLQHGVRKTHLPARVVHLVELLDQSYRQGKGNS